MKGGIRVTTRRGASEGQTYGVRTDRRSDDAKCVKIECAERYRVDPGMEPFIHSQAQVATHTSSPRWEGERAG